MNPIILMADDDEDDRMLMKEALEENSLPHSLRFVEDGAELLDYLHMRGKFSHRNAIRPSLILLDLNMPKIDGREALCILKGDPLLRRIPVVVLTTSTTDADVVNAYDLGVNSFICKPPRFAELVNIAREISNYWFGTVALPRI